MTTVEKIEEAEKLTTDQRNQRILGIIERNHFESYHRRLYNRLTGHDRDLALAFILRRFTRTEPLTVCQEVLDQIEVRDEFYENEVVAMLVNHLAVTEDKGINMVIRHLYLMNAAILIGMLPDQNIFKQQYQSRLADLLRELDLNQ